MSKINIQAIETGLESSPVVKSAYKINGKVLFIIATYDENIVSKIETAVDDEPAIDPEKDGE